MWCTVHILHWSHAQASLNQPAYHQVCGCQSANFTNHRLINTAATYQSMCSYHNTHVRASCTNLSQHNSVNVAVPQTGRLFKGSIVKLMRGLSFDPSRILFGGKSMKGNELNRRTTYVTRMWDYFVKTKSKLETFWHIRQHSLTWHIVTYSPILV